MNRRLMFALSFSMAMVLFVLGSASAGIIVNDAVPFNGLVFMPCADGGAGEDVALEGFVHVLITVTFDADGAAHTTTHVQQMGIAGTGLTTGDLYRRTGITRDQVNSSTEPPFEVTLVNNFRIIGQGSGNNLLVHAIVHLTVNANGEVAAMVDLSSSECR